MKKKTFYLIAAAMAALSAGDAPAQRVVTVAADYLSADFGQYGDADGDGVLERLGKFGKVYDYPEGTIPDPERDDRYCVPWGDSEYYRVEDGAAYYRVLPDPTVSMATYYPKDREPDFSEGGYDFFRITSVDDALLWYAWMSLAGELVYHDGLLYTRSDTPTPTVDDERLTWIKPDGTLIYIDGTEDADTPDLIADLNGDGKADVIYTYVEGAGMTRSPYRKAAYSGADGYRIVRLDALGSEYYLGNAVTADFNRDGRRDIFMFHSEGWAQPYLPLVWLQLADGAFALQPLNVVTDPGEIAAAQFSDGGNGSFTNNSVNLSGFSGPGKGSSYDEAPRMEAVDVNMDGYPDLIDPDGNSFLSLPDGRYYSAGIAGSVTAADINGDGVKDMVVFDGGTGDVVLNLSRGAAGYDETLLFSNKNITKVVCRDLDGDKLSDILLLADTSGEYAYLVFFRNCGDGTFKKTERAVKGERRFYGVYDFGMDGRPTAVAGGDGYYRIDWDASFDITEEPLTADGYAVAYYDNLNFRPYLGDGYMYIPVSGDGAAMLYSPTPAAAENAAPDRLAAPRVIADRSTGGVKVEWDAGSDRESATEDLDYEVAMSGASALYRAMTGGNTFVFADAGTWPLEDVSVKVRAIDPNGLAGPWSDEAVFANTSAAAPFVLSAASFGLADTLVVTAISDAPVTLRALPDGEIVETDGKSAKILFRDMGRKTVEATAGGGGITSVQKVSVSPLRIERLETGWPVDLDADGQVETIDGNIKKYDGGAYVDYPSFSLSDVRLSPTLILDKNMDGKPDVYGGNTKGGSPFPWLINNGGMDFEVDTEDFTLTDGGTWQAGSTVYACDFNNDGLPDFYTGARLYKNLGGGRLETVEQKFDNGQWGAYMLTADFNRDGLTDYLLLGDENSWSQSYKRQYYLAINKGGFDFELTELKAIKDATPITFKVIDVNGDGWTDIVYSYGDYDSYEYCARLGGADLKFEKEVPLPGAPLGFDFDNDGRPDYASAADTLVSDRIDGMQAAQVLDCDRYNPLRELNDPSRMFDVNNDGYPEYWKYAYPEYGLLNSRYKNTAPTAPTQVYATQNQDDITLNWSGASDAETPSAYLRYNVSVREKGTDNYVISPLNGTSDDAATPDPGWPAYRSTPVMQIPASRFTAGKTYEARVQTIDPWYAHSQFSEPVEFVPAAVGLITMPSKGGVGLPVEFSYRSNVEGQPSVSTDGGTLSDNAITWETPGLKTVVVTVNSLRSEHKILIKAKPDLDFALPDKAIGGSVLTVALPEAAASAYGEARMTVNGDSAMIDAAAGTAVITLPGVDGKAEVRLACDDDVFGMVEVVKTIDVVGSAFRPEIAMVTVSEGRNVVSWDAAMALPADGVLDGTVNVYRETNMADEYEKVAVVSLADGRYVDAESRPDVKTTRYMLTMNTAVGGETQPGRVHGNIHVMINRGLGNDINLHWLPYTGADVAQYTILAGTSADDLAVLDVISGNSQSFTHKRDADTPMLYSLAYTLKRDAPAASARSRNSSAEGRSNVISSAEAYGVTMVEAIEITSVEGTMAVDATRPSIRLRAVVTPAVATIANVEWSIIDGGNLAEISPEGVLSVKPNAAGGNVRVMARAVDGSGVTQEADVIVGSYTHIAGADAADGQVVIGVRGRTVMIDGMPDNTDVLITDVAGRVEYRSTTGGSLRISSLPAGVHIVRAGGKTAKVIVR